MLKKKKIRTKGKVRFSEYFKKLKEGDRVAIVTELAEKPRFPKRIHGKTGVVIGARGKSYIVKTKDINKEKQMIIHPIHLKKLK